MGEQFQKLAAHLAEIRNIQLAGGVLGWDQQVNMPAAGSEARAAQLSH